MVCAAGALESRHGAPVSFVALASSEPLSTLDSWDMIHFHCYFLPSGVLCPNSPATPSLGLHPSLLACIPHSFHIVAPQKLFPCAHIPMVGTAGLLVSRITLHQLYTAVHFVSLTSKILEGPLARHAAAVQ